ncbi:alpha/beta hydrolase family protein [Streptomyces sp. NBC_00932]|uniref:alpha/beta hydrolase family protein n=1 Tax=Streptomyces sp. NBC_00932 TaxID=2903690 RepID=UPI0038657CB1|nr:alpha/beta hydrolase [Streptomyces sp. NBC_00932]
MRPATATATAVTTLIGVGAAAAAAGRLAADAALKAPHGRALPAEPRLSVHATAPGRVTLTRCLASLRPGVYGLEGPGVHAVVGPVIDGGSATADTVVRRLDRVTYGTLAPGTKARLTPQVYVGDPRSALGIDHADVDIPAELGACPAWFVPGPRPTWVITVHGLGTGREQPMNVLGFLHRQQFAVLDISYRGDTGAPANPDGLGHLGASEWRDLDAAIRYAVRYGAERVVLHGWSTGAAMALHAAVGSGMRDRISGLILDSPVLDWEATLGALAAARRTPAFLLPLAVRAAQGRTGTNGDRLRAAADPRVLTVPTLVFHGPDDRVAPWRRSVEFAAGKPSLVDLRTVTGAPHGAMWNADPDGYEEAMRRFLTPLM